TVVHLMTELLKPQPGEFVYDPTCGSAGMLVSCVAYLKERGLEWRNLKIYGQEINQISYAIARMNLFLHGIEDFHIANGDVLLSPAYLKSDRLQTFDVVLANPPYSIKNWNRNAFAADKYGRNFLGVPPQGRADFAFIQHILRSMNETSGRCAILLPHGVLFRNEEKELRKTMIEKDLVESVIGLAPNLFFNATMEACILVCRTKKDKTRKNKILFIQAVNEFSRIGTQNFLDEEHINRIASSYNRYENETDFARIVDFDEVANNDFSLNLSLYFSNSAQQDKPCNTPKEAAIQWDRSREELDESILKLCKALSESER
ncbi:MAG: N-6 DNA methylase, partial [Thermoguttaceae bacterium]|nr:N-6 DNA methylase [Thermoguttaceae bacterium]